MQTLVVAQNEGRVSVLRDAHNYCLELGLRCRDTCSRMIECSQQFQGFLLELTDLRELLNTAYSALKSIDNPQAEVLIQFNVALSETSESMARLQEVQESQTYTKLKAVNRFEGYRSALRASRLALTRACATYDKAGANNNLQKDVSDKPTAKIETNAIDETPFSGSNAAEVEEEAPPGHKREASASTDQEFESQLELRNGRIMLSLDEDSDDDSIVSSIFSLISTASSHSSTASATQLGLLEGCLRALKQHSRFSEICKSSAEAVGIETSTRIFCRHLRYLGKELQQGASDALENQVARFLRMRAQQISEKLSEMLLSPQLANAQLDHTRSVETRSLMDFEQGAGEASSDNEWSDEPRNNADQQISQRLPFKEVEGFVMDGFPFVQFLARVEASLQRAQSRRYLMLEVCKACPDGRIHALNHFCRESRQWKCNVWKCNFATEQSIEKHAKIVHEIQDQIYVCATTSCLTATRVWLRLDDFKAHCRRSHPSDDMDRLIQSSSHHISEHILKYEQQQASESNSCDHPSDQCMGEGSQAIWPGGQSINKIAGVKYSILTRTLSMCRNNVDWFVRPTPELGKQRIKFDCVSMRCKFPFQGRC